MKTLICTLALGLAAATGAAAQQPAAPATAPAPAAPASAPAAPAPAAAAPTAARYDLDTPIEVLAADPAAKAVLDKHMPHLLTHPSYEQFKSMSLRQLQPYSEGKITDVIMAETEQDLKAVTPTGTK